MTVFLTLSDRVDITKPAYAGIRRAQIILACHYLERGREDLAKMIHREFQEEPIARLWELRKELESVTTEEFWEYSERGTVSYLPILILQKKTLLG